MYTINTTRRKRKERPVEVPKKEDTEWWDRFVVEGDELFEYMTHNFETLFENTRIKHFNIRDDKIYDLGRDEIMDNYNQELEDTTLQWIREEQKAGRLFQKDLWRPVRDSYLLTSMYLGYRKIFQFKHYVFQLAFETDCEKYPCEDCDALEDDYYPEGHFTLSYMGWKEEGKEALQPKNRIVFLEDNFIPKWYWDLK